ncbi:hypothetical protein NSA47_06970 [Irregularibacter muris]|uniref:Uncharacterized protein n=1 Tax=Irregularibacter muris TaxID=1796619 RepID=A0AAE3HHL9_9FIRM|nr:hypothetical protein [Irregularibacter muris]MCR1898733.1 hypothetical protein [Irregularibacter muris]
MNFIPGLILGVVITLYKDEIMMWLRNIAKWFKSKPWLRQLYYHRLKRRIINKNDVQKKVLVYYYEQNYLSLKQYEKLYELYRSMRRLKVIVNTSATSGENKKSLNCL